MNSQPKVCGTGQVGPPEERLGLSVMAVVPRLTAPPSRSSKMVLSIVKIGPHFVSNSSRTRTPYPRMPCAESRLVIPGYSVRLISISLLSGVQEF